MTGEILIQKKKDVMAINFFTLAISYLLLGIYCLYTIHEIDLINILKSFALANIIILCPSLIKTFPCFKEDLILKDQQLTLFLVITLASLGLIRNHFPFDINKIIITAGIILPFFCIKNLSFAYKKSSSFMMAAILLFLTCLIAIKVASHYWGTFTNPLFQNFLIRNKIYVDNIYNLAISGMIKTTNIPSTGLDGTPYLHYHWGMMWILTRLADLLNMSLLKTHIILFPTIFLPLLYKSILLLYLKIKDILWPFSHSKEKIAFYVLPIAATLLTIKLFITNADSGFLSISYIPGLTIGLIAATIFISIYNLSSAFKISNIYIKIYLLIEIPLIVILSSVLKVSIAYTLVVLYFYVAIRFKMIKKIEVILSIILCSLSSLLGIKLFHEHQALKFQIFQMAGDHILANLYFIFNNYLLLLLFLILFFIDYTLKKSDETRKFRDKTRLDFICLEITIVTFLITFLPANIFHIRGANGLYFMDIINWPLVSISSIYLYKILAKINIKKSFQAFKLSHSDTTIS